MRAIELDINEDWTSFISYRHPGARRTRATCCRKCSGPPERYLTPDERDFFAVYVKDGKEAKGGQ